MARKRRSGERDQMARELLKPNYRRRRIIISAKAYKRKPRNRKDSRAFSFPSFEGLRKSVRRPQSVPSRSLPRDRSFRRDKA